MPARSESAIRLVRAAAGAAGLGERPDSELLTAFLVGDSAAFEALVRRHGPMVLRTCRTATRCEADADDAFQATFVLLHRKAVSLRDRRSVAGWLFRVARRAAANARRAADRRARREAAVRRAEVQPGPDLSWRDACEVLHAELDRLSEVYRLPLVLCYLEGLSRDEAANRLGWSPSVLRGRLDRGRVRLRVRLERRGIALSAGLLTAVAADGLPPNLLQATIRAIDRPPARVAALTVGTITARAKFASLVVPLALIAGMAVLGSGPTAPPPADRPGEEEPAAPVRLDLHGDPLPAGAIAWIGTLRFNHGDGMAALQFSKDGKRILSSGRGIARVWDAGTGKELRTFTASKWEYGDRAGLTADGRVLLPESDLNRRQSLHVWDVDRGTESKTLSLPWSGSWGEVNLYSPSGRLAARVHNGYVPVFDVEAGRTLYTLKPGDGATVATFAGDDLLVTVDGNRRVQTWEAGTGKPVREFDHGGPVAVITASADGRFLATLEHHTGAIDKFLDKDVVHLWDLTTGTRKHTFAARPKRWFMGVGLSPDGRRLAAVAWAEPMPELLVWDTGTGELVREIPGCASKIMNFSPDGRNLAAGGGWGKFDLIDLDGPAKPDDGRLAVPAAIAMSPDGARVSVTGYDAVSTWDATTGRRLTGHDLPRFGNMSPTRRYSPDGRYTATYEGDFSQGRLVVREAATGKAILSLDRSIAEVGFSSDSKSIAVPHWDAAEKVASFRVYYLRTGAVTHTIRRAKAEWVKYLSLVDDGRVLIACGDRVAGYSVADGRELFTWRTPRAIVKDQLVQSSVDQSTQPPWRVFTASPDGTLTAGLREFEDFGRNALPERLFICDARTGRVLQRCSDSGRKGSERGSVRFSPDNRLVASSDGYQVHLWETATGKRIRTVGGHRGEIADIAFSLNGRRLATASFDSTVLVWDVCPPLKGEPADAWADLANSDAAVAWATIGRLADDKSAVAHLRKHLRPLTGAEAQRIAGLVADLDSDKFRTRDRAFQELTVLGHAARPALQAARDKKQSAEVVDRLDQLLSKLIGPPPSGESLRTWRALAVLEAKGTPVARAFLTELAGGADGWLTDEAKAALRRLAR
jgi:RNA polymerase sigma factor (sigma-70 family)